MLKKLAFWLLKAHKVNTFTQIDEELSKLANGEYYSFSITKSVHSDKTTKVEYKLYVDGFGIHEKRNLNEAFTSLKKEMGQPQEVAECDFLFV